MAGQNFTRSGAPAAALFIGHSRVFSTRSKCSDGGVSRCTWVETSLYFSEYGFQSVELSGRYTSG